MCWNESVSLNTFALGLFAVLFGLMNNAISPLAAVGMMAFVSMQLVEYFAWRNINDTNALSLISKIGFLLILMQPSIMTLSSLSSNLLYPFLGTYAAFVFVFLTVIYPIQDIKFTMHKASNGHLAWDWLDVPHIAAFIWVAFLAFPLFSAKLYFETILLVLSFIVCYALYIKTNTWGSMWCWIANAISVTLIALVFAKELC
jgi:hypothetical protein